MELSLGCSSIVQTCQRSVNQVEVLHQVGRDRTCTIGRAFELFGLILVVQTELGSIVAVIVRLKAHCALMLWVGVRQTRYFLLVLLHVAVDVNDTAIRLAYVALLVCLRRLMIVLVCLLLRLFDSLRCALDDGVRDGFFHEVDLALANQFHVRVGQWDQQLLLALLAKSFLLQVCVAWRDRALLR